MLSRRMDATPGLKVTLLDIQRKRGDTTAADQLIRNFPINSGERTGLVTGGRESTMTLGLSNSMARAESYTLRLLWRMRNQFSSLLPI